jgi:hypothetical protein
MDQWHVIVMSRCRSSLQGLSRFDHDHIDDGMAGNKFYGKYTIRIDRRTAITGFDRSYLALSCAYEFH